MAIGNYYPKIITKIAIFADIGKFCRQLWTLSANSSSLSRSSIRFEIRSVWSTKQASLSELAFSFVCPPPTWFGTNHFAADW